MAQPDLRQLAFGFVQRWENRRQRFKPAGVQINPADYEVHPISKALAEPFCSRHHYSGSYCAATWSFGLFYRGDLVGVAGLGEGVNPEATFGVFDAPWKDCTELLRLVLLNGVPGMGESWFVARVNEHLRKEGVAGLLSHSDPERRTILPVEAVVESRRAGERRRLSRTPVENIVFGGHLGRIYAGLNMLYLGRSEARWCDLLPDGRILHDRAKTKLRKKEKGWRGVVRKLVATGAPNPGENPPVEVLRAWGDIWMPRLTRRFFHRGNFKYALPLHRRVGLRDGVEVLPRPTSLDSDAPPWPRSLRAISPFLEAA